MTTAFSHQFKVLTFVATLGLALSMVVAIRAWSILPDTIPIHFGLNGQPNGWGNKIMLWLFPLLSLIAYAGLNWIKRYPHTFHYAVKITHENARQQYLIACLMLEWLRAELIWLAVFTEWEIMDLALNGSSILGMVLLTGIILTLLGTIGFWLRQSWLAR